jgi:prepilin-type processing-associated H-X9-DG protein
LKRIPRFASLRDGTSQVILVGEKAYDRTVQGPNSWFHREPFFLGGSDSTAREGIHVIRDAPGMDHPKNWGAAHPGGANFLLADGSVRLIAHATNWETVSALIVPSGGEIVPAY